MKSRKRLSASRNWCFIILDNDEEDIERLYCCEMYTYMVASIEPHNQFGSMIIGFMQFEKKAGITKVQPCVGWKATLFRPRSVLEIVKTIRSSRTVIEMGFMEDVRCNGTLLRHYYPSDYWATNYWTQGYPPDASDILCLKRAEQAGLIWK